MSAVPNTCPMNGKTHETVFAHLASHTTHIKAWYKAEELGKAGGDETEETADAHALCWYTTYMSMGLGYCDQVKAARSTSCAATAGPYPT